MRSRKAKIRMRGWQSADDIVDPGGPADDGGRTEDLAVGRAACGGILNVGCWIFNGGSVLNREGDSAELSDSFKIQHSKLKIEMNRECTRNYWILKRSKRRERRSFTLSPSMIHSIILKVWPMSGLEIPLIDPLCLLL